MVSMQNKRAEVGDTNNEQRFLIFLRPSNRRDILILVLGLAADEQHHWGEQLLLSSGDERVS